MSLRKCFTLAKEKKSLAEVENVVSERIDWLEKGCPNQIFLNLSDWEEILSQKRERESQLEEREKKKSQTFEEETEIL